MGDRFASEWVIDFTGMRSQGSGNMTLDEEEARLFGLRVVIDMASRARRGLHESQRVRAAKMTPLGWLFEPNVLLDDGWQQDAAANVWVPPAHDAIYDKPGRGRGISLTASAALSNSAGASGTGGASAAAVADPARQKLRAMPDDRLQRMKELEELRKKWKEDPEGWKHRWHSRATIIGRLLIREEELES